MQVIILLGRQGSGKGTQAKLLVEELGFSYIGSGEILRTFYEGESFSAKKTKRVLNEGDYLPTAVMFWIWMDVLEKLKAKEPLTGILFDGSPRKLLEAQLIDQALKWYEWDKDVRVILIDVSRQEGFDRLVKRRICKKCGKIIPWIGKYKNLSLHSVQSKNLSSRFAQSKNLASGENLSLNEVQSKNLASGENLSGFASKNLKACDACGGRLIKREDDTPEAISSRLRLFERETMPVIEYYKAKGLLSVVKGEQGIEEVYEEIKSLVRQRRMVKVISK